MMRKVVEYLRRKQNITIEDLVVEICSSTMYYKYLSKEKNMSCKNLKLIKERLGADDLTKEEISEYRHDLDKIINNIMRYYISKEAFEKDILPLIELEPQLLLCDELCIDYIIAKINYLLLENDIEQISKLLALLEEFFEVMTVTQKLFFYQLKIFVYNYMKLDILDIVTNFELLLENNKYNKDYGKFYISLIYAYYKIKSREKANHSIEMALALFNRDVNIIGQIKVINMKAISLGDSRKYQEVLDLLIPNYKNAKQIGSTYEMFISLTNIITCFLGLNDFDSSIKYWQIFKNNINKLDNHSLIIYALNNSSINLFTNFDYYGLEHQLKELISILEKYNVSNNTSLTHLVEYYYISNEDMKIEYIEKVFLPTITGKAHFSYCKWILDTCIRYFKRKRMYKKAVDFETKYLEEFKKYYFN